MNIKGLVRQGYDRISWVYRNNEGTHLVVDYTAFLKRLIPHLPPNASVLDLGCGCGIPVSQMLVEHFDVTGVDISPVQIQRARELIPTARFLCDDMSRITFPRHSFSAIVAFFVITHLPLHEQSLMLHKCRQWLKPGGYLMITVEHSPWTGIEEDWLEPGTRMYFSSTEVRTYESWLLEDGWVVEWKDFIPEGNDGHTLILAKHVSHAHD